jgi:predicted Zn finger-like uncharacterized protein
MICSCPKCKSEFELYPAEIPIDGSFTGCTECGTNFVILKESFAKRALHKGDEIVCTECGSHPGPSIYCQSCHAIYPDFLVVEITSAVKRRLDKLIAAGNAFKNLKIGASAKSYPNDFSAPSATAGMSKKLNLPGQPTQLIIVLIITLLLSAGGGYYWYQDKQSQKYTESYVRALLGIKMARDMNIRISTRLLADLRTGKPSALTAEEQKSTESAKKDVGTLISQIGKAPEKFAANNSALIKLNEAYTKLQSTVKAPAGTSDTYAAAVNALDDEFRRSAKELKAGLPERISTQIAESSIRFKALRDL